jgi:anti-sigma factor RsiW
MQRHISEVDITNYVLNELEPRERLFVESMMLGCDKDRQDALEMMELARMLEEGFEAELTAELTLDQTRRSLIIEPKRPSLWHAFAKVSVAVVSLAACVAFSVAAPVISRHAFQADFSKGSTVRSGALSGHESTFGVDVVDPGAFPVASQDSGDSSVGAYTDDFPTRVLLPTGTVNFADMPAVIGGSDSN